jgi:hypothetical protein
MARVLEEDVLSDDESEGGEWRLPSFRLTRARVQRVCAKPNGRQISPSSYICTVCCRRFHQPSCPRLWTTLASLVVSAMPVRLRLQRFGRTHSPFYRMVAADSRSPRDGKFLEMVRTRCFVGSPGGSVVPPCACALLTCSYYFYDRLERTIPLPTRVALKKYVSRRID